MEPCWFGLLWLGQCRRLSVRRAWSKVRRVDFVDPYIGAEGVHFAVASDSSGLVHIRDAVVGGAYSCHWCRRPMVAKQGAVNAWHFAHKLREFNEAWFECDGDGALHKAAMIFIVQEFRRAVLVGRSYLVGVRCPGCGAARTRNVAVPGATIAAERSLFPGTRSDLVIERPDERPLIIEVVVSHEMERDVVAIYERERVAVLSYRPYWPSLDKLRDGVIASSMMGGEAYCAPCKIRAQAAEAAEARRRLQALRIPAEASDGFRQWDVGLSAYRWIKSKPRLTDAPVVHPPEGSRNTCMCGKPKSVCGHWPRARWPQLEMPGSGPCGLRGPSACPKARCGQGPPNACRCGDECRAGLRE